MASIYLNDRERLIIRIKDCFDMSFKVGKGGINILCRSEEIDEERTRSFCRITIGKTKTIEIDREAAEYGIVRVSCMSHEVQYFVEPYKITFLIHEVMKFIGEHLEIPIEKKFDGLSRTYDIVI